MLKDNVKDEDIIKYSHITKEELNKLKLQMEQKNKYIFK